MLFLFIPPRLRRGFIHLVQTGSDDYYGNLARQSVDSLRLDRLLGDISDGKLRQK